MEKSKTAKGRGATDDQDIISSAREGARGPMAVCLPNVLVGRSAVARYKQKQEAKSLMPAARWKWLAVTKL